MKPTNHLRLLAVFCIAMALSPMILTAQTTATPVTTTTMTDDNLREEDHDYGWIGLLGLLGLAPFFMRKRTDDYRADTTTTERTDVPR